MLTELGLYKLLREDPEVAWRVTRLWMPSIVRFLAPSFAYGVERMPATGGAVVASNHFSAIDPPLVGAYSLRTIYFMAKTELLEVPLVGEYLRWIGTFAVRRGEGDRDSLRVARWVAAEGHVAGMFMEGTRQKFGYPGPAHPGAAMIAIQEGVPVVPCGIDTFGWSLENPRPCAVVWGEPIDLGGFSKNGRGYKEATRIVEEKIIELWRLAAEAVAAGFPAQLQDGARRYGLVRSWRARYADGARPWPREPWAAGPLGPVYRP